jgi:hypothetical protein
MRTLSKKQIFSLFLAGLFFGGALDHILFALNKSETSHYGFNIGISGNWIMALLDTTITALLVWYSLKKSASYMNDPKMTNRN